MAKLRVTKQAEGGGGHLGTMCKMAPHRRLRLIPQLLSICELLRAQARLSRCLRCREGDRSLRLRPRLCLSCRHPQLTLRLTLSRCTSALALGSSRRVGRSRHIGRSHRSQTLRNERLEPFKDDRPLLRGRHRRYTHALCAAWHCAQPPSAQDARPHRLRIRA